LAGGQQVLELQVVEQVDSHRVERQNVDREVDALGAAGCGVAVAVAAKHCNAALRDERHRSGMQARFRIRRRPWPELAEATGVTGANEEHVTLADGDALLELGGLELVAKDVLARLEPRHSPETGDIEQDASGNQAVREDLDRIGSGAFRRHGRGRNSVVQRAVVDDVAECVDVRVAVVVVIGAHEVLREQQLPRLGVAVA
jgi:hypothetical protein